MVVLVLPLPLSPIKIDVKHSSELHKDAGYYAFRRLGGLVILRKIIRSLGVSLSSV